MDGFSAKLVRSIVGLALLPAAFGVADAALGFMLAQAPQWLRSPFGWGFALALLPALLLALKEPLLDTLEHELGHYTAARVFGHEVIHIEATRLEKDNKPHSSGNTLPNPATYNGAGHALIALAPYYLPLFSLPFLVARPLMPARIVPIVDCMIGATLVWHYATVAIDLWQGHANSDLGKATPFLSLPVILIANLLLLVGVTAYVLEDLAALPPFAREAWSATVDAYRTAFRWLAEAMGALRQVLASIL